MPTIITFRRPNAMEQPPAPVRVSESVEEVVDAVNDGNNVGTPLLAMTDAETGKRISVDASKVENVKEE